MKTLLSYITLLFVGIFLCIPLLFSVFSHHMDMGGSLCVEHCLDAGTFTNTDLSVLQLFFFPNLVVLKIVFERVIQEVFLTASLLFFFLIFVPPNRKRSIKNYDYSSLIGIVKLSN